MKGKGLKRLSGSVLTILAIISFCTISTWVQPPASEAADKVIKWRCQSFEPPPDMWIARETMKSIEIASGGRLKIEVFSGGELVPSPEILKSVGSGMIEMGMGFGGYWPSRVDMANIESGLPMTLQNIEEGFDAYYCRGLLEIIREAYKENKVRWWPKFASLYAILSTKPITSLEDMQKMKIRVAGPTSLLLKSVGVPTAYIPFEEVYMALATGTLDGAIMGPLNLYKNLKMYEVAPYYTDFSFMMPIVNVMVNLKAWEKLPEDLKEIVDLALFKNTFTTHQNHIAKEYALRRELTGQKKLTVTKIDPESIKTLRKAAKKVWEAEAKKSERNARAMEIVKQTLQDRGLFD